MNVLIESDLKGNHLENSRGLKTRKKLVGKKVRGRRTLRVCLDDWVKNTIQF